MTLKPSQRMALYRRKGERAHALRQLRRRNRYFRLHDDAAVIYLSQVGQR